MTTKKKQQIAPPKPTTEFIKSPNFRSIYTNWIQAQFSPHDFSFLLGEAFQPNPETIEVQHTGRVIMGPLEAKLLMFILGKLVSSYEQQFGLINIPDKIVQEMTEQIPELKTFIGNVTEGD